MEMILHCNSVSRADNAMPYATRTSYPVQSSSVKVKKETEKAKKKKKIEDK